MEHREEEEQKERVVEEGENRVRGVRKRRCEEMTGLGRGVMEQEEEQN